MLTKLHEQRFYSVVKDFQQWALLLEVDVTEEYRLRWLLKHVAMRCELL